MCTQALVKRDGARMRHLLAKIGFRYEKPDSYRSFAVRGVWLANINYTRAEHRKECFSSLGRCSAFYVS